MVYVPVVETPKSPGPPTEGRLSPLKGKRIPDAAARLFEGIGYRGARVSDNAAKGSER